MLICSYSTYSQDTQVNCTCYENITLARFVDVTLLMA